LAGWPPTNHQTNHPTNKPTNQLFFQEGNNGTHKPRG
jgi:hypothetical protein